MLPSLPCNLWAGFPAAEEQYLEGFFNSPAKTKCTGGTVLFLPTPPLQPARRAEATHSMNTGVTWTGKPVFLRGAAASARCLHRARGAARRASPSCPLAQTPGTSQSSQLAQGSYVHHPLPSPRAEPAVGPSAPTPPLLPGAAPHILLQLCRPLGDVAKVGIHN